MNQAPTNYSLLFSSNDTRYEIGIATASPCNDRFNYFYFFINLL